MESTTAKVSVSPAVIEIKEVVTKPETITIEVSREDFDIIIALVGATPLKTGSLYRELCKGNEGLADRFGGLTESQYEIYQEIHRKNKNRK